MYLRLCESRELTTKERPEMSDSLTNNAQGERFRDPVLAINRVYTRHGDQGETSLVGGQKVSKAALRIESYGTVDELNSYVHQRCHKTQS